MPPRRLEVPAGKYLADVTYSFKNTFQVLIVRSDPATQGFEVEVRVSGSVRRASRKGGLEKYRNDMPRTPCLYGVSTACGRSSQDDVSSKMFVLGKVWSVCVIRYIMF